MDMFLQELTREVKGTDTMSMQDANKRKFTRTAFETRVDLLIAGQVIQGELCDVSLKGVLVSVPSTEPVEIGQEVKIKIHLSATELVISADGVVAHLEDERVGVKFTTIDIDSMTHLRRLLEYNTDDVDKIEKELSFLLEKGEDNRTKT